MSVQGMSLVVYALQMKAIHAFGGTFPVTEKVIYTFLYYYVIDNHRYIHEKMKSDMELLPSKQKCNRSYQYPYLVLNVQSRKGIKMRDEIHCLNWRRRGR